MAVFLVHENVVYEDQAVYLSGSSYFDCTFTRCTLIIKGPIGPLTGCTFDSCVWHLDMMVHDHRTWDSFVETLVPYIGRSLPRAPGE